MLASAFALQVKVGVFNKKPHTAPLERSQIVWLEDACDSGRVSNLRDLVQIPNKLRNLPVYRA